MARVIAGGQGGRGINYKVTFDDKYLNKTLVDVGDMSSKRAASRLVPRVRENIEKAGRVDTGRMSRSTRIRQRPTGQQRDRYAVSVDAPHALFQEEGTRAHGPVTAKFLRFKPKGSSTFVYAKWVRGVTAAHFLRDAYHSLRLRDFLP